jgi:O-acetylserine/cysteine efflux transporter
MTLVQIFSAVLVPLLWGVQFVVIKVALTAFPPFFLLTLRFTILAAVLIPFVPRPRRAELKPLLLIALFMGGMNFSLAFLALAHGSAGNAAIAIQLTAPFALVLAWPLLKERPTLYLLLGVLVAFCGVALTTRSSSGSGSLTAPLLMTGSAFALAMGSVLAKRHGPFRPMMLLAWMSAFTVPQVLLLSCVLEHGQLEALRTASSLAWLSLGYTVVLGGIAAFGLWFWLIGTASMSRVAPYGLLQTLFGVMAGVLLLDEPLTLELALGMVLSIAGVALTQRRPKAT